MTSERARTLVILSARPQALVPTEHFLVNRGWNVRVYQDEREALRAVLAETPSFMLVSIEHPNKKATVLHEIMKSTRPELCVIYFGESNDIETYRTLTSLEHFHRIPPPLTGPAVERAVNRHWKDLDEREREGNISIRLQRRAMPEASTPSSAIPEIENVLAKGVLRVLEETAAKSRVPLKERLDGFTSRVACVFLETPAFAGHLVTAVAGNREAPADFLTSVQSRLRQYLRDHGQTLKGEEGFRVDLLDVKFGNFAARNADFVKKSLHGGFELATAFFRCEGDADNAEPAPEGMKSVRLGDLVGDARVDFDLYLPLPRNNKQLLYTRREGIFYATQKDRFAQAGMQSLYIRDVDHTNFRRYRARNQLNSMIQVDQNLIS